MDVRSNDSVSLFKAMLQWLANCTVKDSSFKNYSLFALFKAQASINTSNLAGAYIRIFTGALISHNAQDHPIDVVTVTFCCLRLCYSG